MKRFFRFVRFLLFYAKEVVVANLQIAAVILRPGRRRARPAFVVISVAGLTDRQLLVVTNLITMTPGTLSFDVDPAGETALLHLLLPDEDVDAERRRLEESYVRRVRSIF